jgi:hypothetical protein
MTHQHLLSAALLAAAFAACTSHVVDEGDDERDRDGMYETTSGAGGSTSGPSSTATGPFSGEPCGDTVCELDQQCYECEGEIERYCATPPPVPRPGEFRCTADAGPGVNCDIATQYCSIFDPDNSTCGDTATCLDVEDPDDWCPCVNQAGCIEERDGSRIAWCDARGER